MEEPVGDTALPDVDDGSSGSGAAVVRRGGPDTASDVGRRRSLADFTELRRRRDVAQFKGLVVPSPSVGSARSSVCLPTIAAARPQSKLLSTSSTQQRRASTGYQSVLTGLPFSTSWSRSGAAGAASGAQRRSSVYGYPVPRRPSDSSFSSSLLEFRRTSPPANSASLNLDLADKPDLGKFRMTFSETSRDGVEASAEAVTRSTAPGISSHRRDETPTDDKLASRHGADNDDSFSSARLSSSSSANERSTTTASLNTNSLKTGERREERTGDVVETLTEADTCLTDELDIDGCPLPTSEALDHSVVSPIMALQSTSVDDGRVRLSADGVETATDAGQDVLAGDTGDVENRNCELRSQSSGTFIGDSTEPTPRRSTAALQNVVIDNGSDGLGFCITGGREGTTGDSRIVVERVFGGSFHYVVDT